MFIDEAKIRVKAGDGGNGCLAFRREKFVPRGGPSGGDGGKGGDVIMESSERHNTLVHFRFNPEYKAERGRHGEGANKTGREGGDVVLKVPVGTIVYDEDTGEKIYDFSRSDERVVIARGGRGGRGNARFATSVHQAPREHEAGRPGEERTFRLELKLLVDVSDASGREDVIGDIDVIMRELKSFGAHLEDKPMIMVASKIDAANKDRLAKLKKYCKKRGLELCAISAVTGKGIDELKYAIAAKVKEVRAQAISEATPE